VPVDFFPCSAFCRKVCGILPQNAVHYAAKRDVICGKMGGVLPQNAASFCGKTGHYFAAKRIGFRKK
jgi:hypothetical protein